MIDIKWQNQIVSQLIKESPNSTIKDYQQLLYEIQRVAVTQYREDVIKGIINHQTPKQ